MKAPVVTPAVVAGIRALMLPDVAAARARPASREGAPREGEGREGRRAMKLLYDIQAPPFVDDGRETRTGDRLLMLRIRAGDLPRCFLSERTARPGNQLRLMPRVLR